MKFEDLAKSFALKELPESEVEITGDVLAEVIAEYKDAALMHIAGELDLPGFRKGSAQVGTRLRKLRLNGESLSVVLNCSISINPCC